MPSTNDERQADAVVWDLSEPTTPRELGSSVDLFVEADGPTDFDIVFPSGRRLQASFERGGLAEAVVSDEASLIRTVVLLGLVTSPGELRDEVAKFTDEWGPIDADDDIDDFIAIYDAAFEKNPQLDRNDFGGVGAGKSVRSFDAAQTQDGISAVLIFRVSGDALTVRWSLRFDPEGATD